MILNITVTNTDGKVLNEIKVLVDNDFGETPKAVELAENTNGMKIENVITDEFEEA